MTKYEDVKKETTEEYFKGNEFSIDAFKRKYALTPDESYVDALKRVCDYVASVEKTPELRKYWSERWFDEIYNDWWHPAGSIMQGAGSGRKISLANCTTISGGGLLEEQEWDNLESIFKNIGYTVAKCAAYRQGLGVDFSRLRPKGTPILNSANESDGAIHWMKYIDSIGYRVGQKGRIPAMLFSLSIHHPDVIEFIKIKKDFTQIQNANISVQITDDFYKACDNDEMWKMEFVIPEEKKGQKVYVDVHSITKDTLKDEKGYYYIARFDRKKEVIKREEKARTILNMIAYHMSNFAEPGIQNISIARKYSNSDAVYDPNDEYDSRILSTNACCVVGETKIMTDKGWIEIIELYKKFISGEKFLIMSYNIDEKKYELQPMTNSWQQRNDTTVKLEIEENNKIYKIECSSDHKLYTTNRGYVEAASLTEDDDILIFH